MSTKAVVSRRINDLFDRDQWDEARTVLEEQLTRNPDDHWLLTRISTTHYEQRDYAMALQYAERAYKLASHCPLVLWDYAGALHMLKRYRDAIDIYKRFINDWPAVVMEECSEGEEWGLSVLADVFFRLGICCARLGKKQAAYFFFNMHQQFLATGEQSLYSREEAQKEIAALRLSRKSLADLEIAFATRQLKNAKDALAMIA